MARKRLGELLLEQGAITSEQLQAGLVLQRQSGNRLGAALVAEGVLTEERLTGALATALGLQVLDLDKLEVEWSALHALRDEYPHARLPARLERWRFLPQLALVHARASDADEVRWQLQA